MSRHAEQGLAGALLLRQSEGALRVCAAPLAAARIVLTTRRIVASRRERTRQVIAVAALTLLALLSHFV